MFFASDGSKSNIWCVNQIFILYVLYFFDTLTIRSLPVEFDEKKVPLGTFGRLR